jgi:hypothetical protein
MRVRAVSFGGGSYRGDGRPLFRFPGGSPRILRRGGFEAPPQAACSGARPPSPSFYRPRAVLLEALEAGS